MNLTNVLRWIGRSLGILHIVFFAGAMIYLVILLFPWMDGAEVLFALAAICFLLGAVFYIFLRVAWRREIRGGVLYLVLAVVIALLMLVNPFDPLIWQFPRYLIPTLLTGVLFLTSGILK